MRFTNSTPENVLVFVYHPGHGPYLDAIDNPGIHMFVWADAEALVPAGQTVTLHHPRDPAWMVGVKRADNWGRVEPFIVPLSAATYRATDALELTFPFTLNWLTAPVVNNPTPRLAEADLMQPLPRGPARLIGVGQADVSDWSTLIPESALPMQGWADMGQTTMGVESGLHNKPAPQKARAFIIADADSQTRAVMVICDIWSCSLAVRQEVIRRITYGNPESPYARGNILIAGTHTHSGPGGYLHHFLYNAMGFGFDPHVFEAIVAGIVCAIEAAHKALAPGRVRIQRGQLTGITRNRSARAFAANPAAARARFPDGIDTDMTQLLFEYEDRAAPTGWRSAGLLNWFAIHPTNLGKVNRLVSGDNKGWASILMEEKQGAGFVAAFANGCCGDVSGNFDPRRRGFTPAIVSDPANPDPAEVMAQHARKDRAAQEQFQTALKLMDQNGTTLDGPVSAAEVNLDLPQRCGVPAALGMSFPAGSAEDGGPGFLPEGITMVDPARPDLTNLGSFVSGSITQAATMSLAHFMTMASYVLSGNLLGALRASVRFPPFTDAALVGGHFPKPILLVPGELAPDPWVPDVVPVQVLRVGQFALAAIPAEVTVMAGEQMRDAMAQSLSRLGVEHRVVCTYANGYASYITTAEEYGTQHYEGASNLYGGQALKVFCDALSSLGQHIAGARAPRHDAPLRDFGDRVITKRRMTFRNDSGKKASIRLYDTADRTYAVTLGAWAEFDLAPGDERAVIVPFPHSIGLRMVQVVLGATGLRPSRLPRSPLFALTSDLVILPAGGGMIRHDYFATDRQL